jgi:hypothetical protein
VVSAAGPTALEIAEYGNKAVENRLKIKSWHVRVEREDFNINRPEKSQKCLAVEFYVDGIKNRTDQTWAYGVQGEGATYTDYMAEDGINLYTYSSQVLDDGTPVALTVIPLKTLAENQENSLYDLGYKAARSVADIRVLGFVGTGMNYTPGNYTGFVQHLEDQSDLQMEDDEINGIPCKKISYTYRDPSRSEVITAYKRYWIAPEQGYSILRSEGEPGDKSFFDRTEVTVEKHQKTGLWVPVKSVFERTGIQDGKRFVKWSERLKLEYLSLNENIPEKMFTPETMNIPVGRAVHITPPPGEPMFWDGKKVVGESGATLEPVVSTHGNPVRYFLIALGLGLICIACLKKYFELSKKRRETSGA